MSPEDLSREELLLFIDDLAKRWLAHDGLWFQAVEKHYGMSAAIELDGEAWADFTRNEAQRILNFLGEKPGGGLDLLQRALAFRLYARVNTQESERVEDGKMVFRMTRCRVQEARRRKGLPDFPCKEVGIVEYTGFAAAINPQIRTRVIACPPDDLQRDYYCAWEFTLPEAQDTSKDENPVSALGQ
ncbi:hypothetical protein D2Q93_09120 [Alicyclobacillaceae bacterium I2511]|nr:hypothetical protein D2Q93_09120 [Alicyclobacillaceae bacterium I2511]